jgi:aconitate hydratase
MTHDRFNSLQDFSLADGSTGKFYSLAALEQAGLGKISRLPVSVRIVLESVLRNCDGKKVTEEHVRQLAAWNPTAARTDEIPFVVARVVLQDFTGVPLLCDLAPCATSPTTSARIPNDRAARPGRPGRRPFGADRLLRRRTRSIST